MATRKSYEDYLKTITPGMLGGDGRFLGPGAGVNYQAEGMTPQQFYDYMTQQVETQSFTGNGGTSTYGDRGAADAGWTPGAVSTGSAFQGKSSMWGPLAQFIALVAGGTGGEAFGLGGGSGAAGSGMSIGEADAALAAFDASQVGTAGGGLLGGATTAPVAGGTLGVTGTALPELAAIGGEGVAGLGGLEAGGLGAFPSAMGTETGFGMGFGSAGAGAGIEGYGGVTGLLAPGGSAIGSSSMIDKAGQFIKDNPTLAKIGGAAVGAFANSKDTKNTNTQSTDPWAPAQPYLLDNLKTNAAMQEHYRANPFSNEQKTAYQGLLNTVANNQANAAPMTANANAFMKSNRGRMPAMQGLLSGTQAAPIDWNAYANIGRK